MKTLTLFILLIIGFFGIITVLARPDIIEKKYSEIRAPVDKYFAEKNSTAWKNAKNNERAAWMMKLHLPPDCETPKTALRELECRNSIKLHAQTFEQNWAYKTNSAWKPDGVSN